MLTPHLAIVTGLLPTQMSCLAVPDSQFVPAAESVRIRGGDGNSVKVRVGTDTGSQLISGPAVPRKLGELA